EVALGQPGVADAGEDVLVGQWEEELQGRVVKRRRLPREARYFGLDAVHQRRRHALRQRDLLLHQVAGDQRTGRPDPAANVEERHAFEVAGRGVVVDDGVEWAEIAQVVPPGVGLAVHHDHRFAVRPGDRLDGQQVKVEQLDHGPVLGPADRAVAGDPRGFG